MRKRKKEEKKSQTGGRLTHRLTTLSPLVSVIKKKSRVFLHTRVKTALYPVVAVAVVAAVVVF